jgi:hypothetical protein
MQHKPQSCQCARSTAAQPPSQHQPRDEDSAAMLRAVKQLLSDVACLVSDGLKCIAGKLHQTLDSAMSVAAAHAIAAFLQR